MRRECPLPLKAHLLTIGFDHTCNPNKQFLNPASLDNPYATYPGTWGINRSFRSRRMFQTPVQYSWKVRFGAPVSTLCWTFGTIPGD